VLHDSHAHNVALTGKNLRMSPEDAAVSLLRAAGLAGIAAPPIDVLYLAEEHVGLDVQEHADLFAVPGAPPRESGARLSGLLFPEHRRIYVNAVEAKRSHGRKLFTVAHELGHWHLHRGDGTAVHTRFCSEADVGAAPARLKSTQQIEHEANRFAAALLMPEPMVRSLAPAVQFNVRLLAQRFDVSVPAMQVRLEALNMLPDYMRR